MTTTTVLMIIIALNALATINLWREAARRPARPSEKFVKALLRSEPIVPKHGTPTRWTYEDDAYVAKYERTSFGKMIRARRLFFYDFADFAVIVNSWFEKSGDRWRLQELADNELRTDEPPPRFGRRYSIFYNQTDLGVIEMQNGLDKHGDDYSEEHPVVWAEIQLHSVRLLELMAIKGLLQGIATHISDLGDGGSRRECEPQSTERYSRFSGRRSKSHNIHPSLAKRTGVISNAVFMGQLSGISSVENS